MKTKLPLCLALALSSAWWGGFPAKADLCAPVVAAPEMRECREAQVKDLGLWDAALRFENLDFVLLRKGNALFSYSPVSGRLRKVRTGPNLVDSLPVDGVTWGGHQWVFCAGTTVMPFAIDLASGKTVNFEIPGVKSPGEHGPAIAAVINAGAGPGTIIGITGDGAVGWPRDGNRPLYYWMNLESGKVSQFPTGWDLSYFSADQKSAVFEDISTNAMRYRPWVTVDMATGKTMDELPDQTKGLWSEPLPGYWQVSDNPWNDRDYLRHVWELRSPRTPMKLLYPQPGRGFADDTFAGLSVNGADYPLTVPEIGVRATCLDAKVAGHLAVFAIANDGHTKRWAWATRLDRSEPPRLLATNRCDFESLDDQHCALVVPNQLPAAQPEAFVYDVESNAAWNVLDGTPLWSEILARFSSTNRPGLTPFTEASGIGPTVAFRLIPGFGSARYPTKVLCLCSTAYVVPDYMIPPPERRMTVLLTAEGRRYQVNLPPAMRDQLRDTSWLHNSGKLIVCEYENTSKNRGQLHLYEADLRADQN